MSKGPSVAHICGKDYSIVWEKGESLAGTDNVGYVSVSKCEVRIASGQHIQQQRDTLLHELLHIIWSEIGIGEVDPKDLTEERVIRPLATAIIAALRDNPALVRYLLSK